MKKYVLVPVKNKVPIYKMIRFVECKDVYAARDMAKTILEDHTRYDRVEVVHAIKLCEVIRPFKLE